MKHTKRANVTRFVQRALAPTGLNQDLPAATALRADRSDAHPVLVIEGSADLTLGPVKLVSGTDGLRFYVGAWTGSRRYACGAVHGAAEDVGVQLASTFQHTENRFKLELPIDVGSDPDVLKLQIYCEMLDEDTGITKPFPLVASVVCMHTLCKIKSAVVDFKDPFETPFAAKLWIGTSSQIDTSRLKKSALYWAAEHNQALDKLGNQVKSRILSSNVVIPKAIEPFIGGTTTLSNGGSLQLGIPPPNLHYATMSQQIGALDARVPHSLLAYNLQQVITLSGKTIDEVNALGDKEFASFAGDVLWGVTTDATKFEYEGDNTLEMGLVLDLNSAAGIKCKFLPMLTESIIRTYAAAPMREETRLPRVPAGPKDAKRLSPKQEYARLKDLLEAPGAREQCRAIAQDDCENSAIAGITTAATVKAEDMSPAKFMRELAAPAACAAQPDSNGSNLATHAAKFGLFRHWSGACYVAASQFYTRVQDMLRSGRLSVELTVGMAGAASAKAGQEDACGGLDDAKDLCGHCFAALRFKQVDGSLYVRLLEGTTNMRVYHDKPDLSYICKMSVNDVEQRAELPMSKYLTMLSATLESKLKTHGVATTTRSTVFTPCLHSLDLGSRAGSEIGFYKWCMFTGLAGGDAGGFGSLPLDDLEYPNKLAAGCRPANLANRDLRGVGFDDDTRRGAAILDETWPPIMDKDGFHRIMALWEDLEPLKHANSGIHEAYRRPGETYVAVATMESPASPALSEILYELKALVCKGVNQINLQRQDSDGAYLTSHLIGTGVAVVAHVLEKPGTCTLVDSINQFYANLNKP